MENDLSFKVIPAKDLHNISEYVREVEKKKVFNNIMAFIIDACVKKAQAGEFSCEFDIENYNSLTFKSYFKNIDIEWIYPDIESTLENEKYGYKVFLEGKKIIVSW